jgi:hypothetical protein
MQIMSPKGCKNASKLTTCKWATELFLAEKEYTKIGVGMNVGCIDFDTSGCNT